MSLLENLLLDIDKRGVASLMLNRPEVHNALSAQMIQELQQICEELDKDKKVRVIVLSANGKSFCAGGDLRWMKENMAKNRQQRIEESTHLAKLLFTLNNLSKPLIGKINGSSFGGGVGLVSVCDFAICSGHVTFGLTEVKLGLVPATISPYVIRRIGETHARRNFLNARIFGAQEALTMNLVASVVPEEKLDEVIEKEISLILKCGPGAIAATKELVAYISTHDLEKNRDYSTKSLADIWETDEALLGVEAFFNKTKPFWFN